MYVSFEISSRYLLHTKKEKLTAFKRGCGLIIRGGLIPAVCAETVHADLPVKRTVGSVFLYFDTSAVYPSSPRTELEVMTYFRESLGTYNTNVTVDPSYSFLDFYNDVYDEWWSVGTAGGGNTPMSSDRKYGVQFCLQPVLDYYWPYDVLSLDIYGDYPVTMTPLLKVFVNGVERYDAYIRIDTDRQIRITVPLVEEPSLLRAELTGVTNKTYNGYEQEPFPDVKLNGETLVIGTDYYVDFANNVNPGTAFVLVRGTGAYSGTAGKRFTVYYRDVPGTHKFKNAVYWATEQRIAAGYTGSRMGYFGVSDNITRGQVVTFLWRAAGRPEPANTTTQTFSDVPVSHNFFKAIQWASEQGITGGYTGDRAGQFGPSDSCTRGQIATFLWRFAGQPVPENTTTQTFTDVPVKHKFFKAIQWAYENEITGGYTGDKAGQFGPSDSCTRGQCVTFLYRLLAPKG